MPPGAGTTPAVKAPAPIVACLFLRDASGRHAARSLTLDRDGVRGAIARPPLRQLLLVEASDLAVLGVPAGRLGEDVVLEGSNLMQLESGSTLRIGHASMCLTFRCEPCAKVRGIATSASLAPRRGYLASVIRGGVVEVGDRVQRLPARFDPIPDAPRERIAWRLARGRGRMTAAQLLHDAGLHSSYARALRAWLAHLPPELSGRVRFVRDGCSEQAK